MSTSAESALEALLAQLSSAVQRGRPLERALVRQVLLALGALLDEERGPEPQALVDRILALLQPRASEWSAQLGAELEQAAIEYDQCVDPRYLSRPDYDLAYTLRARDRLRARLLASAALGAPLPEALERRIRATDERLAPYVSEEPRPDGPSPT
jgi:hypothetical protein